MILIFTTGLTLMLVGFIILFYSMMKADDKKFNEWLKRIDELQKQTFEKNNKDFFDKGL